MLKRQICLSIFAAIVGFHGSAMAEVKWPERPIRLVVPFAPGGGVDIAARLIADKLSERWNNPVVVENKPGANTLIAVQSVLRAPKDGYTLLITNPNTFSLPAVNPTVAVRPLQEFVPVAELSVDQLVVLAPGTAGGLSQILDSAKKGSKLSFGTYGYGTIAHLLLEQLNKSYGLDIVHVPYRGTTPLVQAMLGNEIELGVSNYGTAKPFIESGRLRPVAVYGSTRSPFMPDVPTLAEAGVSGFDSSQWIGVFAPVGTPGEIVERIAEDVTMVLRSEATIKRLAEMFTRPGTKVTKEFGELVERDAQVHSEMSQAAGIRMDR